MANFAHHRFWKLYEELPPAVRETADQAFAQLKENPRHPSLHLKKVGRFWSARVDARYRALAIEVDDGLLWVWIGDHDAYERLVAGR